tara:strand:+ start:1412 stop:1759 length:348 start_codon:yes stop_codon:yes gene_type:complete
MKKTFLAISFCASLITGSLSSPAEASSKVCKWTCRGTNCSFRIPSDLPKRLEYDLVRFERKNNLPNLREKGGFLISAWADMSLPLQRRYCSACGWGHVRVWSGNYCDKTKSPGNY